MKRTAVRASLAALVLMALAFFLRVHRLGDKNIWWDEGWTVWMAQHDFAWIALRTASDEHPPLHYWLMNLWQSVLGTDAFTGRFVSLVFGVLLIALIYRIGKEIGGVRVGLLAALFLGLARFNVWWSQDIKNYTLSAFFAWASVWFTWELMVSKKKLRGSFFFETINWFGYVLATTLALYSHYLAALVILANNVFVGVVLVVEWRSGKNPIPLLVRWALAQIAVVVLFAPWLYVYLQNGATWSAAPTFDFGLFLQLAATVLTLGVTTYIENYTFIVLALLLIAAFSLGWLVRLFKGTVIGNPLAVISDPSSVTSKPSSVISDPSSVISHQSPVSSLQSPVSDQSPISNLQSPVSSLQSPISNLQSPVSLPRGTLFMLLIALIPPALIYALSLTPAAIFAPKIQARYLMMLTPAVAMLLALGILFVASLVRPRIAQFVTAALVLVIVAAQFYTLNDYFKDRILRDEYFSLSQMINNFGFDDDAIVLNTDQEYPTFLYYLKRPFAWVGVPNGAQVTEGTAQRVAADALQHDAVWVVTIPDALQKDPTLLVEQALAQRLKKQYEQTFGDKRLVLYTNTIRNVKDVPPKNFSPQVIHNDVFDDRLKLVGADVPVREAFAGDVVSVVTYWQAQDLTTINLSLQMPDGKIVARSAVPISIGAYERAQGDLQVPPDARANELRIVAQARLNTLSIGTIHLLPRENAIPNPTDAVMQARDERFGDNIRLMGVTTPQQKFRAGENVPITLFWQTGAPLQTSYTVFVHLLGDQYNPAQNNFLWGQVDRLPVDGKLPTTAWTPNQTIADAYQVKLEDHAPAGVYKFEIGLYDASGTRLHVFDAKGNDRGDALILGRVEIGNE